MRFAPWLRWRRPPLGRPSTPDPGAPSPVGAPFEGRAPGPLAPAEAGSLPVRLTPAAAAATRAAAARLRERLRWLAQPGRFALGHQDGLAYGVGWVAQEGRSDVGDVCGAHAAVHGWDLFRLEHGADRNGDGVPFALMRERIVAAHRRGGVSTVSWHADNPVSGGDAWDTARAVADVLPGGRHHATLRVRLGRIADFFASCRGDHGERIPMLFRPFHEHNGRWFWWGAAHTTRDEYVALFRYAVEFLREERGLDHLVFVFSPGSGGLRTAADVVERYPGDDVVDVLGVDAYFERPGELLPAVTLIVDVAESRGKVAALTEFGRRDGLGEGPSSVDWLGASCLEPLLGDPRASRIAYALAWRNADRRHSFLPYSGHPAAERFAAYRQDPRLLLEGDFPFTGGAPGRQDPVD